MNSIEITEEISKSVPEWPQSEYFLLVLGTNLRQPSDLRLPWIPWKKSIQSTCHFLVSYNRAHDISGVLKVRLETLEPWQNVSLTMYHSLSPKHTHGSSLRPPSHDQGCRHMAILFPSSESGAWGLQRSASTDIPVGRSIKSSSDCSSLIRGR